MKRFGRFAMVAAMALLGGECVGCVPGPPVAWIDFPVSKAASFPGEFSAAGLSEKPAGKAGGIVVKDGHFYTRMEGGNRIRFLGVNFCFAACFPTHEQADRLAPRLAGLGINAVRFHHMDSQPFPNGIFNRGDWKLETLDPEALDRLDYFIAALKQNGIYADMNLHVSRWYTHARNLPGAEQTPGFDKLIDLFDPELIAAQKRYASDLLTHVNAYTTHTYADEPAVCMVEINNENTFFTWGGEASVAGIPEPYAGELRKIWNGWLLGKYGSREKLAAAWSAGVESIGQNLLKDSALKSVGKAGSPWVLEQHENAAMAAADADDGKSLTLNITKVTDTSWHLQFMQGGLALKKDQLYTVRFTASADADRQIEIGVSQDHANWQSLGLGTQVKLSRTPREFSLHFTANADEARARISFSLGQKIGNVSLGDVTLVPGGRVGLLADEDPAKATVKRAGVELAATNAREHDWLDFLQQQDEGYFTGMRNYLRDELHVKAPITGTIGLGALGTLSQSKMDYVDAHAYWDHPQFPGKPWDPKNWRLHNTPMVDAPDHSTLPGLAAIRVAGKPFTVTEYNEGAPNEWQAECLPMIATFAALQDWDAVYLFAWSHNAEYDKDFTDNFFDIKANPAKLLALPAAARIFRSGNVPPLPGKAPVYVGREESLSLASRFYFNLWPQLLETAHLTPDSLWRSQLAISFSPVAPLPITPDDRRAAWRADAAGSGQFSFADPAAAVFVGFPAKNQAIALGPVRLSHLDVPFIAATLVPADGNARLQTGGPLLLTLMARTQNTAMRWNAPRNSVSADWGTAPTQIEPIHASLEIPAGYSLFPVDGDGKKGPALAGDGIHLELPGATPWYLLTREH